MKRCAPSMGANLWGASPMWEYRLGLVMRARITTSRRQGRNRKGWSGGSRSARGARVSPDRNNPEDCSCLARGRASGSARPARHGQKTKFQRRLICTQVTSQLNRMVKAEGCEASWRMTAKPTGTQPTVNAALVHRQFAHLPQGDLRRERCALMVTDPDGSRRDIKNQALRRAARCMR